MEGEIITLSDLFVFEYAEGREKDGRIKGRLQPTGMRPASTTASPSSASWSRPRRSSRCGSRSSDDGSLGSAYDGRVIESRSTVGGVPAALALAFDGFAMLRCFGGTGVSS